MQHMKKRKKERKKASRIQSLLIHLVPLTAVWKTLKMAGLYSCHFVGRRPPADRDAHGEEYVRDNCSQQSEKLLPLPCTARFSVHNLLYVMLSRPIFFSPPLRSPSSLLLRRRKGKLIAKRDENLFSYWLGGRRVPGWRRTAVGEGWPTRCLLPLPCLAAQSL